MSISNSSKSCLPCSVQGSLGTLQIEMTPRAGWHGGTRSGRRRCSSSTPGRCHPCRQACNRQRLDCAVAALVCNIFGCKSKRGIKPAWSQQTFAAPGSLCTTRAGYIACRPLCSGFWDGQSGRLSVQPPSRCAPPRQAGLHVGLCVLKARSRACCLGPRGNQAAGGSRPAKICSISAHPQVCTLLTGAKGAKVQHARNQQQLASTCLPVRQGTAF